MSLTETEQNKQDGDDSNGPQFAMIRPPALADVSYISWIRRYNHYCHTLLRASTKDRVLQYGPVYKQADQPDDFSRVKLMLHHPFREESDLLIIDGRHFSSFAEAFDFCTEHHSHGPDHYGPLASHPPEEDLFEDREPHGSPSDIGTWEA